MVSLLRKDYQIYTRLNNKIKDCFYPNFGSIFQFDSKKKFYQNSMNYFKLISIICTDEYRKDETCLQLKMNKHFIKTRNIPLTY